ncbi:hypothetical protein Tco_0309707 [Tanacetum coccineum]
MAPKRTPTSAAPAMSQAAIKKLVADSVPSTMVLSVFDMVAAYASTNGHLVQWYGGFTLLGKVSCSSLV